MRLLPIPISFKNMNKNNISIELRLSAQKALWGHVTPCLRTASIENEGNLIKWKCVFDDSATDDDFELMSMAGTEIIGDFTEEFDIDEEFVITPYPNITDDYKYLVYYRHEHNYYKE